MLKVDDTKTILVHSCSECRFITDIHFENQITHVWTKDFLGNTYHHPLHFHPKIYVIPQKHQDIEMIRQELLCSEHVVSITKKTVYPSSEERKVREALQLAIYSFKSMATIIKQLRFLHYDIYNIDLNPRQQFFLDYDAAPLTRCHLIFADPSSTISSHMQWISEYDLLPGTVELKEIQVMEDIARIDYVLPPMYVMAIQLEISHKGAFPKFSDPIISITLKYKNTQAQSLESWKIEGSESDILRKLHEDIQSKDPDLLMLEQGDKFTVNYLAHRASYHNMTNQFYLGRLPIPHYPRKQSAGSTYMTYGVILHKDQVAYIPGRIHLDYDNSFMLHESGIDGLIDISRLSATAPERASRASIGTVLTGVEFVINQNTFPQTLVPPRKTKGELFKSAEDLLIGDNGGLTYPAIPGVYDRVWAMDFTSLYPYIMLIHNIGGDTMLCEHRMCVVNKVPELGYHICTKRHGVVARTMALILERRLSLKLMRKYELKPEELKRYKEIDSALKWLLVCCFGYLGFKNSRWGSIEGHQTVTAYARRYLLQASRIAYEEGFEIIAGIVDSLFVRALDIKDDTIDRIVQLVERISRETKIPLDVEGRFTWVVFGKVRDYNVMALNRYYGYFDHDEFKLRGIRLRQRRITEIERKFQQEILEILKTANNVKSFMAKIPECYIRLRIWKNRLLHHEVDTRQLIIKLKSHVGTNNYKSRTQQALVTQRYQEKGKTILPGQNMLYIVRDDRMRDTSRILIGEEVNADSPYDITWYCELLEKALEELVDSPQFQHYNKIVYGNNTLDTNLNSFFNVSKTDENLTQSLTTIVSRKKPARTTQSLKEYFFDNEHCQDDCIDN